MLFILSVLVSGEEIDSLFMEFYSAQGVEKRNTGREMVKILDKEGKLKDSVLLDEKIKDDEFNMLLVNKIAPYLFKKEKYDHSCLAAKYLVEMAEQVQDTDLIINGYYYMGYSSQRMGEMDDALKYNTLCYELTLADDDREMQSAALNNIGNVYMVNGEDSVAVIYFRKSIDMEREMGRKPFLAVRLGNISTAYMKLDRLEEALEAVEEGLALDRENGRPDKIAIRLNQMGNVYLAMQDYDKAMRCESESYEYFVKAKSVYGQSVVSHAMGEISEKAGRNDDAKRYFRHSLELAEKINNNLLIQKIYKSMYELCRIDDPAEALKYFEKSTALKDSTFHAENQKLLSDFQVKYETREKELEIENQKEIIRYNRLMIVLTLVVLLLFVIAVALLIRKVRNVHKRNTALNELNLMKDRFLSLMSHDLKNPAIAQQQILHHIRDNMDKMSHDELNMMVRALSSSSDAQVDLLMNLLDWTRIQAGRMQFNPESFDLVECIKNTVEVLSVNMKEKNINVSYDMPSKAMADSDKMMITTVIRNILNNAVKFSHESGVIEMVIKDKEGKWNIEIIDHGVGMKPEVRDRIFVESQPSSSLGTNGETGSGLGLMLSKKLMDMCGEEIWVESEEGRGTRFGISASKRVEE